MTFWRRGQVSMEYAIIFAVTLAAIFATGIIDKSRDSFKTYFTKASGSMTTISSGAQAGAAGREKAGGGEVALGPEATAAGGQPQDSGMAAIAKVAADAKVELAGLQDTYAEKKGRYDKLRAIPIIGMLLPEFDNTRDGKMLKLQINAYEKVVGATSPLVKGE